MTFILSLWALGLGLVFLKSLSSRPLIPYQNLPLVAHGFVCMKLLKPLRREIGFGRKIATASLGGFGFLNDSDLTIEMSVCQLQFRPV